MQREQKKANVEALKETFSKARFAAVTDYRGLKVADLEQLRRALRKDNAIFQVAKNTLLRRAVQGTAYEGLTDFFIGTTAITFSFDEPVGPAKTLADFSKEHEQLVIRSAGLEGNVLSREDVIALSKLPGKDELRAMFLGTLAAVPTGLVRVLNGVPQKLVYALEAIKEQKDN